MGHPHRFHISPDMATSPLLVLPPLEARHARGAARVRPGDPVTLFDGQGRELTGTVARADRDQVAVEVIEEHRRPRPDRTLTLLQAWLNHEKSIEAIVRSGTELGVSHFRFFKGERSERAHKVHAPKVHARWHRIVVEACKQCGRAWFPTFDVAEGLDDALHAPHDTLLVATKQSPPLPLRSAIEGERVALLVGPEGDLTDAEIDAAVRCGGKRVSFGPMTFRSEVAAALGASLILYELGQLGPFPQEGRSG